MRRLVLAAGATLAVAALAAGWCALEPGPRARSATRSPETSQVTAQVAAPIQAASLADAPALELDASATNFLEAFAQRGAAFEREGASRGAAGEALARARQGELSPGDLRQALDEQLRAGAAPGGVARLLVDELAGEGEDTLAFAVAQALSRHLDGAATRVLVEGLPRAPYAAMALRGSRHARVAPALADRFQDSGASVLARQLSGFVLAEPHRLAQLSPTELAAVRDRARSDLLDSETQLQATAADVLGAAPLDAQERGWLEGVVSAGQGEARVHALRALASSGLTPADLRPTLERAAHDSSAPALQALARQLLAGESD